MDRHVWLVIGGVLITYLLSRLARWLLRSMGDTVQRVFAIHALAYVVAILIAAYGLADGGRPRFDLALAYCTAPQVFWLVLALIGLNGRQAKSPSSN